MTASLRSVARWVARHDDAMTLELVCAEHPAPAKGDPARTVVRLPCCLADVPAHEILELFTAGAQRVVVRRDGCAEPERPNTLLDEVARVLAAAGVDRLRLTTSEEADASACATAGDHRGQPQPAVGAAQPDEIASPTPERGLPAAAPATRRGLLGRRRAPRAARQVRREVLDADHMPVPRRQMLGLGSGPVRELADEYGSDVQRLNAALAALLPAAPSRPASSSPALPSPVLPSPVLPSPDLTSPAVRLRGRGCTACGVCVRACPTDALSLRHLGAVADTEADATPLMTTLVQDPTRCDGCQVCVQICPEDVLTVEGLWGWDAVLSRVTSPEPAPVASLATAQCQRCRTRFPTTGAGNLCAVCAYRRQNPFSSRLPPGA